MLTSTIINDFDLDTVDLAQMAAILHKSEKTIKNLVYKSPDKLPPRIKVPGRSDFLWRKKTVVEWLDRCEKESGL